MVESSDIAYVDLERRSRWPKAGDDVDKWSLVVNEPGK